MTWMACRLLKFPSDVKIHVLYTLYFLISEAPHPCLPSGRHTAGPPGNLDMITGSAFLPAPVAGRRGIQPTCP
jgi:hypothetical protein